ncbi:MAG: ATP-binding protein [Schaalia hyovaginalis]|uniref:ATP-binding protein n=1 Tax=Schaalia hyovaginalis TaxID=29316 RepID=UPI0023F87F34|nr:ATP-binding protein [Schaalia hyovaginalis]MCI7672670.1 ATP-binding protein [Schaalia hyovaginalis]MDY4261959.1 ATP-binding protein [Schaalia hyovaginalis]MDY5505289.1 ATP-binding protein [Schaalia hyovaginalis]
MKLTSIVPRRVSEVLVEQMRVEPVVALHGPRSVGKSTVLRAFAAQVGSAVIDLDDIEVREAVEGNLGSAVSTVTTLCIDEYQRLPDVLDAIKARLNREGSNPGTAVITGSTRQDALPRTVQALTGRLHSQVIWPLSQGEIAGVREDFLERLLADVADTVAALPTSTTSRDEYVDRVCSGGMPLALRRTGASRARWFDDFVRASVERDAVELSRIRERQALADLLGYLASQTGQLLNVSAGAQKLGINRATAENHLRLLEDLFLVVRLPAWGKTLRSRVSVKSKVHVVDSGLATRLLRLTPDRLRSLDPAALTDFGHLLETFVVGEFRKQASWLGEPVALGHWRTSDGDEVDLVIERDDGRVLAIEVKASERAPGSEFRGMTKLRDLLGDRFLGGIMMTTGKRSYTYQDRLHVIPIDRLWTPVGGHTSGAVAKG